MWLLKKQLKEEDFSMSRESEDIVVTSSITQPSLHIIGHSKL